MSSPPCVGVLRAPDASRCVQRWGTAERRPEELRPAQRGMEGGSGNARLGQTSSRFPGEARIPLTSASYGCGEGRRFAGAIWPGGRCEGPCGRFLLIQPSAAGSGNMAKHRISAYLTLQLSACKQGQPR